MSTPCEARSVSNMPGGIHRPGAVGLAGAPAGPPVRLPHPAGVGADAQPGVRVRVPLRSAGRVADGFLIETVAEGDYPGSLSDLEAVVSPVPVLAPEVWALARSVADRAAGSASDVLRLAVPKRQVRVEKAWLERADAGVDVTARPVDVPEFDTAVFDDAIEHAGRLAVDAVPRVSQLPDGAGSATGR